MVRPGRGSILMRETRKAMVTLEELDPEASELPEGLQDNSLAREILEWFTAMVYSRETLPQEIRSEQNMYYRSLFNLSTDKRTRLRLVDNLEALKVIIRYMEVSENDDDLSTLVAAVANLVYEDSTKLKVMSECNVPPLFTKLLRVQTNTVATHAARGVFSLTTVYEFKKRFAMEDGLLEALISCLTRDSKQLIMNAAGAIANIAIHPDSKVPIVELGALTPLLHLGLYDDDEGVLHQVSRCLFSLAAEKANRSLMCDRGITQILSRMLNYVRHHDILANAVGCFGNLAMTEALAQDHSMPIVLRILPILASSEHSTLVRQATRVLFSFSFREVVRSAMSERKYLEVFVAKLDSTDENVVRDVTGIISSIVSGSLPLKQEICELGGFRKLVQLFRDHSSNLDILGPITRAMYAILNCELAKECLCKECPKVILALCHMSRERSDRHSLSRHALGALANIACDEKYLEDLFRQNVLAYATKALFFNSRTEARKQAGRLLYNITRRHGHALSYLSRFGGNDGEDRRLKHDFKRFFHSSFSMLPLSALTTEAEADSSETLKKRGFVTLYIPCLPRRRFGEEEEAMMEELGFSAPAVEMYRAVVLEALVIARCPQLITKLSSPKQEDVSFATTVACWTLLFEFVYTNMLSLPAGDLMEDGFVYDHLVKLGTVFGLKDVLEKISSVPCATLVLPSSVPQSSTIVASNGPFTVTVSCSSSSQITSSQQSTTPSSSSLAHLSDSGDQLLFGGASVPDPLDVSIEDCPQHQRDEDSQHHMLQQQMMIPISKGPQQHASGTQHDTCNNSGGATANGTNAGKEGAALLRDYWESSMYSMLSAGDGDVCFSVTLDPTESISAKRMTRARKASIADADSLAVDLSSFIQSMIDDWHMRDDRPAKLVKGQRKRSYSTCSREVFFRAHKSVLVARSMYFRTLFDGPFRDGEENVLCFRGPVDALVVMLRFLYFGVDPQLSKALADDYTLCWRVLFVAHEYSIEGLQYFCERCIIGSLESRSGEEQLAEVAEAARLSAMINAPFLKMICADYAFSWLKKPKLAELSATILDDTGLALLVRPSQALSAMSSSSSERAD